jgi:septation ring formation regulator EzrA
MEWFLLVIMLVVVVSMSLRFRKRHRNELRSTEEFKEILDKLSPDED